ncbi:MAG: hypothetical protein ACD_56C00050G0005 [uncultured bacterium]|nr:MAG: hypothetical protein ACD_56C00050G0005 [uncultured bacterium]
MAINPHERVYRLNDEDIEGTKTPEELLDKMGRMDEANKRASQNFIRPATIEDQESTRETYAASVNSLEIEISSLDTLATGIFNNPDSVQLSIYNAKVNDIQSQIESLGRLYKSSGCSELDSRLEIAKNRFQELKTVDTEKIKANLG